MVAQDALNILVYVQVVALELKEILAMRIICNALVCKTIDKKGKEKITKVYPPSEFLKNNDKIIKECEENLKYDKIHSYSRCDGEVYIEIDIDSGHGCSCCSYPSLELTASCDKCRCDSYPEITKWSPEDFINTFVSQESYENASR